MFYSHTKHLSNTCHMLCDVSSLSVREKQLRMVSTLKKLMFWSGEKINGFCDTCEKV